MLNPTYPGVYVEEIPSGVRTIAGVGTSVTAFVGYARRGPMDRPTRVLSWADYVREFGGLDATSEMSYAVSQFFLNGGTEAIIVRVAKGAVSAGVVLRPKDDGTADLVATAVSEGAWGNNVVLRVDYATDEPDKTFNLTVSEMATVEGREVAVQTETYRNLVAKKGELNDVVDVVNAASGLVRLRRTADDATLRPVASGTFSPLALTDKGLATVGLAKDQTLTAVLSTSTYAEDNSNPKKYAATVKKATLKEVKLPEAVPTKVRDLADWIQKTLRETADKDDATVFPLAGAIVRLVPGPAGDHLVVYPGGTDTTASVALSGTLAEKLKLDGDGRANLAAHRLGAATAGAQAVEATTGHPRPGVDGSLPGTAEINPGDGKKGVYALEDADLFNILCVPETMRLSDTDAAALAPHLTAYAAKRRAFYILDLPMGSSPQARDQPKEIEDWLKAHNTLRDKNVAIYYPRLKVADPLKGNRLRTVAPSGTLAGLYARTDAERGVWKAPAGTEAALRGVQELEYNLTDGENGVLNPLAVNCLRTLSVYGNVSWGARTFDGSDQKGSEWKYIPVRRTALFIEESLYRGLKWAVFEPNDEPLWSQIRLNVGSFMHDLFRRGAFQGGSPAEAYFVKCDKETTTQSDINRGIVNVVVGFAPLKPAEFVVLKLTQIAGQLEA